MLSVVHGFLVLALNTAMGRLLPVGSSLATGLNFPSNEHWRVANGG